MLGGFYAENPITSLCWRKSNLTYFLSSPPRSIFPFTIQFLRRYPLYKPLKILLELVILDDSCVPRDETQDKALNEIEKWVLQAGRLSPISALERNGRFAGDWQDERVKAIHPSFVWSKRARRMLSMQWKPWKEMVNMPIWWRRHML